MGVRRAVDRGHKGVCRAPPLRTTYTYGKFSLLVFSPVLTGPLGGAMAVAGGASVIVDGAARVVADAPLRVPTCPEDRCPCPTAEETTGIYSHSGVHRTVVSISIRLRVEGRVSALPSRPKKLGCGWRSP